MLVLWFAFVMLNKKLLTYLLTLYNLIKRPEVILVTFDDDDDDDDEIAYFTVRWITRATLVYRTKNMR